MQPPANGREVFLQKAGETYDQIVAGAGPASAESFDQIEERVENTTHGGSGDPPRSTLART